MLKRLNLRTYYEEGPLEIESQGKMNQGDYNSKYFHRVTNGWRKEKYIKTLASKDGVLLEDQQRIIVGILSFFRRLYKSYEDT